MTRFAASLALVFAGLAFALAPTAAAHAGESRWIGPSFCVDDQTRSGLWPVEEAVVLLNRAPNVGFAYEATYNVHDTPRCQSYSQRIRVTEILGGKGWGGLTGYTYGPTRIRDAWVILNLRYPESLTWGERQTIVLHELVHGILGDEHNEHPDSIMNNEVAFNYPEPTARDYAAIAERYDPPLSPPS